MMGSKLFHLVGVSRPNEPAAAALPRVRIAPALPDRKTLDGEIARLRNLDVGELRGHWHNVFGRRPHPHLPATSCSAFWLTGCKPTCWVIWTARAKVCSTVLCLLRTQGNAPWIW